MSSSRTAFEVSRTRAAEIDLVLLGAQLAPNGGAEELLPEMSAAKPLMGVIRTGGDSLAESLERELQRIGGVFLRKPSAPKTLLRLVGDPTVAVAASSPSLGRGFSGSGVA